MNNIITNVYTMNTGEKDENTTYRSRSEVAWLFD